MIYDRHFSLFIFRHEGVSYIPAESVYAVFEVKQEVNSDYLTYAGERAESVRNLKRTFGRIVQAGGDIEKPKEPKAILAGFLALDSKWADLNCSGFRDKIQALRGTQELQLGCIARHGAFEVTERSDAGVKIELSRPETAVMSFVLTLTRLLQGMGSVPAIKIEEYARHL